MPLSELMQRNTTDWWKILSRSQKNKMIKTFVKKEYKYQTKTIELMAWVKSNASG